MVAILLRRICNDIEMNRHDKQPNDYQEETSPPRQDDVQMGRSPPLSPLERPTDDKRDHPQAGDTRATSAAPLSAIVNASMSDITYNKRPSFEQRDEQRSAFAIVQSDAIVPAEENQEQHRHSSPSPAMPRPIPIRAEEPLPFESPTRYYHQQQHVEEADVDAPYPYQYHPNQGYPPYQGQYPPYGYPGYYPQPEPDSNTSAMMTSNQYHPPYTGYHPQEYSTRQPQEYSNHYSYYPSATSSQHPASTYSAQYSDPHHHYYNPGATPPTSHSSVPDTLKETPSAVTESTKGTTPSSMGRKPSRGGEGLDYSPSPSMEDDRKQPGTDSEKKTRGILKKDSSPPQPQGHHDFEPIPLHEISAIPVLSSARMQPPSPTFTASSHRTFAQAFPQVSTPPTSFADPFPAPHHRVVAAASHDLAPPAPRSTPVTRRQHRTLAPSSSGSTASGEGGSWERRFNELFDFKRMHGHCEVPQNFSENTSLGTWVNKQRMEQKNRTEGKNSSLNDSRLERLQSIGFRWAKRKGQASWDEKFNELEAYKAKFGNCHVPTKYKANSALGRWVSTQRAEYKKYQEGLVKTSMNAVKIRRLESIGFAWFMAL